MNEPRWLLVSDYAGLYEVSSDGRVRSVDRTVPDAKNGFRHCRSKVLKWSLQTGGYRYVSLYKNGRGKSFTIHSLVARAFIPNPKGLREIDHVNGDKTNNNVENLEWVSMLENRRRAWSLGLYRRITSEEVPTRKLTREQVIEIRALYGTSCRNQSALARRFGVRPSTINSVVKGRSWKN